MGSWDALWDISAKDANGNASSGGGAIILEDTEDSLVCGTNKLVALVGMKDVIVVDTKDAILICKRGRSQNVKKIVDRLEAKKMKKYL